VPEWRRSFLLRSLRSCAHRDASPSSKLALTDPSEECSHTGEGRWLDSKQRVGGGMFALDRGPSDRFRLPTPPHLKCEQVSVDSRSHMRHGAKSPNVLFRFSSISSWRSFFAKEIDLSLITRGIATNELR
jgi:hypothetical protein